MQFSRKNNFNVGPGEETNLKGGLKVGNQEIGSSVVPNFPCFSYFSYNLWTSFKTHLKVYM